MAKGLWQRRLAQWAGGAGQDGQSRTGVKDTPPGGTQQQAQPDPASAVLQEALAQAQLSAEAVSALQSYHAALQALEGRGGAKYRAGVLEEAQRELEQLPVPASLGAAVSVLKELFADCADVVFRGFLVGGKLPALLLYVDGMVEEERIELSVLDPLIRWGSRAEAPDAGADLPTWLEAAGVTISQATSLPTVAQVVDTVLGGDAVLVVDGVNHAVKLASRGWQQRAVEEPIAEPSIRGPREGFVESLRTNTMLVRRRVRSPHLKMERLILGRRTKTIVDIVYVKDVASPSLVAEVRSRLERIEIDGIIDTGMIEELIEDQPASLFPQIANTERPDRVAGALLEGQVVIMADGSPFALSVPATLWSLMQAGEDYYERFWIGTALRWLRFLFALIALVGPSLFIAITTFHQEMLPTALLLSIAASREGVPFPALVETLLMEVFFEALREAGVRLPRTVGQAVSIVGALVIGQAAVQAGLVSAPVVIIVAATGIASFTFPRFNLGIAIRLLRFPMMLLAGSLGLFGIMVGLIALLVHLCALRSFGVPYLQPLAPLTWSDLKDVIIRAPLWLMGHRPAAGMPVNRRRQGSWLKPGPGGSGG